MCCGESVRSAEIARSRGRESVAAHGPDLEISGGSENPQGCRNLLEDFPAAVVRPRMGCALCADLLVQPASWGQSAECRGRGGQFLQWGDSLRSNSAFPSHGLRLIVPQP